MKRSIVILFTDGSTKELELSKATKLKFDTSMLHLDKLPDGTWRLIFSQDIVKDFSTVDSLYINRED